MIHGHARMSNRTPEFIAWANMLDRCYNPNKPNYKDYGGRGIMVCERWGDSFENFLSDMGLRPSDKHSLDRFPNNDGNYEPSNCRWATRPQQQANTTRNVILSHNGKSMNIKEWSKETGIAQSVIAYRIKSGLPSDRILFDGHLQKKN